MTHRQSLGSVAVLAAAAVALAVGCAHPIAVAVPGQGGSPSPGVTPSPGMSSSPSPCGTPDQVHSVSEFVAMTSTATATSDPTYGVIDGYTDQYPSGFPSQVANVITVAPSTLVQFVNLEPLPLQPPSINHSAAALPTAFPSPSYTFPPNEMTPLGTEISTQPWSTGAVGQDLSGQNICYSQTLAAPTAPGVYPFGDLEYFGLSNMRDVIVVSGNARVRRHAVLELRRATPEPGFIGSVWYPSPPRRGR